MRHKKSFHRKIASDAKYGREDIAKFINYVMRCGKKSTAQRIVYQALEIIKEKTKKDPLKIFEQAMENVSPTTEVRSRRIGGANYQIPFPVQGARQFTLGSRWIIGAARGKEGKSMAARLAEEILNAANNQGAAIEKKDSVYRMAQANKAFAHFAKYG